MYKAHPIFNAPTDGTAKIWRYMDFARFVSLISTSSLYFTRADQFSDPFEGSYPMTNVTLGPVAIKPLPPELQAKARENIGRMHKHYRRSFAINCWHCSEHESAAMWDIYGKLDSGIAIQSNYCRLVECFEEYNDDDVFIGLVNYIDYTTEWMPEGNLYYPFVHKRKSFEHERELRAVISRIFLADGSIDFGTDGLAGGLSIQVDIDKLIENVYVSPVAPPWIISVVQAILDRYEISRRVTSSDLQKDPVW